MLCPHCKQQHPDELNFCPYSGKPIPKTQHLIPPKTSEQPKSTRPCPHCGFILPIEAQFCPSCGQSVQSFPVASIPKNAAKGIALPISVSGGARRSSQRIWIWGLGVVTLLFAIVGAVIVNWWLQGQESPMGVAQITLLTIPVSATISATVPGELVIPTQSPDSPTVLPSPIFTQSPLTATSAFTPSSTPMPSPTSTASLTPLPDHPLPQYDLAFSSNRDGKFSIYLMDSSNPKQWLALPSIGDYEYTYWPTFCGSRLAFEAIDTQSVLPRWIYFVDLVQMSIEKLELPTDLEAERLSAPGCSPKGRFIAYSVSRQLKWYLTVVDQSQGIVVFETTNRRYPQLGFPSWTADENFLYWMGALDTGYFDINESFGLLEPANAVTNVVAKGKYPAISPDGKRLAYFCGNLSFLCLFDWPSGKKLDEKLVSYYREIGGKPAPASAAWSADGKWLYFSSSAAGHWDIYRISRDGGDALNLTEFWDSDELMPATR